MIKIAVCLMSICFLFSLANPLPAPTPTEKTYEITIDVLTVEGVRCIDLGEKYAIAVPRGATIKWKSTYDFILQFEGESPIAENPEDVQLNVSAKLFEKKIKTDAKTNYLYKYTVFVVDGSSKGMKLDPVIIIIPPRK